MFKTGIAYLLWLISGCGALGFHRFYLGKIPTGILWMFTGGVCMIGAIYDFFTLPAQVREANMRRALLEREQEFLRMGMNKRWRYAEDGSYRVATPDNKEKEHPEKVILRLAKANNGYLTVSEVAMGMNISMDNAKQYLETLTNKGFAELRVRKTGSIVYVIPDMADKDEPLEDI